MRITKKRIDIFLRVVVLVLSLLFLYVGNQIATRGVAVFEDDEGTPLTVKATVKEVLLRSGGIEQLPDTTQVSFEATITTGERAGETVPATQTISSYSGKMKEVDVGDKILLMLFDDGECSFMDYERIDKIIILAAVFVVLLLIFGRVQGLNAILSLCLTCAAIFSVFLPSLLSGRNIYAASVIVCVYSIVSTQFIVYGVNRKSFAAMAGCFGGIVLIGLLSLFMNGVLGLTGVLTDESQYLMFLPLDKPIDLVAVIFAGIMIGAVGAIMDVAISIASALWELKERSSGLGFGQFLSSGLNIGRDVMGTMTNTLVLAYIGSSLSVVLLLFAYTSSMTELMNRELVIVELLQAIVGSIGILLTMPLTALVCAILYKRQTGTFGTRRED